MAHCRLCGQPLVDQSPRLREYTECRRCRVLNRSSGHSLEADYYEAAYATPGEQAGYGEYETEAWHRWDNLQLDEMLHGGWLPREGSLLDVGCGWGRLVRDARARGIAADGFEVSRTAAQQIEAFGVNGARIYSENLDRIDSRFDVVTLFEVIEHLDSPRPVVRQCRELLKPGGTLIGTTGNYRSAIARAKRDDWKYLQPEHVIIWSKRALRDELERAGFGSVTIYTGLYPRVTSVAKRGLDGQPVGAFQRNNPTSWIRLGSERLISTSLTFIARAEG